MTTPTPESPDSELSECLAASYPDGDGACYEHFLRPVKTARCAGCDTRRGIAATVDGEHYCAPCAVAICRFARAS